MGKKPAARTSAVHNVLCVVVVTSVPRATVWIHEPTFEIRADDQTRAKLRDPSGRNELSATMR
jgi:hypothetical protein